MRAAAAVAGGPGVGPLAALTDCDSRGSCADVTLTTPQWRPGPASGKPESGLGASEPAGETAGARPGSCRLEPRRLPGPGPASSGSSLGASDGSSVSRAGQRGLGPATGVSGATECRGVRACVRVRACEERASEGESECVRESERVSEREREGGGERESS